MQLEILFCLSENCPPGLVASSAGILRRAVAAHWNCEMGEGTLADGAHVAQIGARTICSLAGQNAGRRWSRSCASLCLWRAILLTQGLSRICPEFLPRVSWLPLAPSSVLFPASLLLCRLVLLGQAVSTVFLIQIQDTTNTTWTDSKIDNYLRRLLRIWVGNSLLSTGEFN